MKEEKAQVFQKSADEPVIYLIEDDPQICDSLTCLLESVALDVQSFATALDFLQCENTHTYGCIISDIRMPGLSGMQLLETLKANKNILPIIIISGYGNITMAVRAIKLGAFDFISKPYDNQYLLEQVQSAVASSLKVRMNRHLKNDYSLTSREKEILCLIGQGKMNKQIAHELNISISTVECHRAKLMKKTGCKTLVDLIKMSCGVF
jgi:two-component system response regulator FixJ